MILLLSRDNYFFEVDMKYEELNTRFKKENKSMLELFLIMFLVECVIWFIEVRFLEGQQNQHSLSLCFILPNVAYFSLFIIMQLTKERWIVFNNLSETYEIIKPEDLNEWKHFLAEPNRNSRLARVKHRNKGIPYCSIKNLLTEFESYKHRNKVTA